MNFKYRYLISIFIFISMNIFSYQIDRLEDKHVLLINSYHKGLKWTDEVTSGVESAAKKYGFELHIEYMDSKRLFDSTYQNQLLEIIKFKHSRQSYDVIITSDDNAFNLINNNREIFSYEIPIVFCGLNNIKKGTLEKLKNVTGLNEVIDIKSNIELIKKTGKFNENIFIITENSVTGNKIKQNIKEIIPLYKDINIDYVYDISIEKLLELTESLPENTSILLTIFFRDANNRYFDNEKLLKLLLKSTKAPIYVTWDFNLNLGVVGGDVISGFIQGVEAGEMCARILEGEDPKNIPIIYKTPTETIFDYRVLKKYDINIDNIEYDSIINRPKSLYRDYPELFWLITTIILLLSLTLSITLIFIKKLRISNKKLGITVEEYKTLVNNIPGVTYRCKNDKKRTMKFIGNRIFKLSGYDSSAFINNSKRTYTSIIHPEDRDYVYRTITNCIEASEPYELEYRIVKKDNTIIWLYDSGRVLNKSEELENLLDGLLIDISKRKLAENELLKYRNNLEQIVKERTEQLNISLENLKKTQAQLIETEKMASIGSLVTGVAHEINTPIGIGVTSASHLYLKTIELKNAMETEKLSRNILSDYIEIAYESSNLLQSNLKRVANLINTFKQISIDQFDEEVRSFKVNKYLSKILNGLFPQKTLGSATINFKCDDSLIISSLPGVLSRVIASIVSNSISHGFKKITDGIIDITIYEEKNDIKIIISDNGCGMNKEDQAKIFDPFYTTDRGRGHIGLGMNIAYNLVHNFLNGTITCNSNLNSGTEFIILFPKLN